jgi:Protein of unknown function (DUF2855)
MQVETTDFLVDLADIKRTKISSSRCFITEGDVLVRVEQFAITANNMTYALIGASTGWYWDFFPAPRGWGRIPVWGFGKVVASEVNDVEAGEDLFGYFPMSTHVVLKPGKIRSDGLHDASEHRAHLSPAYNYYVRTSANRAFDTGSKREIMLLRLLFFASFLVHDLLAERVGSDADAIAITSASSKTAIGLAHLLSTQRIRPYHIVGLTSERNLDFCRGTGVYNRVVAYGDREIVASGSVAVADFSGNSALIRKLQDALGNRTVFFCLIGYTHWDRQSLHIVEDAKMVRFFAPDQIRKRVREWGAGEFDRRYNEALQAYIRHSRGWLQIVEGFGPKKLARCLKGSIETRSALMKGISSLCTREKRRLLAHRSARNNDPSARMARRDQ